MISKFTTKISIATSALMMPMFVFAATSKTLSHIIGDVVNYLTDILFLMVAVAVVVFVFQVIRYYILPNEDRKKAGLYVMYSVIGFFVILSLWGIVAILGNTFGLDNTANRPASWQNLTNLFPSNP